MFKNGARLLVPSLALLLLLTACGAAAGEVATLNSPEEENASATPAPSVDPEDAIFQFAECMREHGIDMPDPQIFRSGPGEGGGGIVNRDEAQGAPNFDPNSEEFKAAQEACAHFLEGFAAEGGQEPELTEEQEQAMLEFAECMREHGIDMPDPGSGGFSIGIGGASDSPEPPFDPFSEEFQAAQEACGDLLGDIGPSFEVRQ